MFDGPSYDHAEGCTIEWNEGKDVTVKVEKKKQKKKSGKDAGKTRTVTKIVKQPSFFHFFNPPKPLEEGEEENEDEGEVRDALISNDFEVRWLTPLFGFLFFLSLLSIIPLGFSFAMPIHTYI